MNFKRMLGLNHELICGNCHQILEKKHPPKRCPFCQKEYPGWSSINNPGICPKCRTPWVKGWVFLYDGCPKCGFKVSTTHQLIDLWGGRIKL